MDETLSDVVGQSDGCESPVSDGLIVDDGVARDDHLINDQSSLVGQWRQDALVDDGRDVDNTLRYRSSVSTCRHDPIADLNFGSERCA